MRALLRRSFGHGHLDIRLSVHRRASQAWVQAADLQKARTVYPIIEGICGHRVTPFTDLDKFYPELQYFTLMRDPFRRMVSDFWGNNNKQINRITPEDLEMFCADPINHNVQTRYLCGSEDPQEAIRTIKKRGIFVGLTELYDESLVLLSKWLGKDELHNGYLRKNTGKKKTAWPILEDPHLRSLIEKTNAADIEVYRYVSEIIFPRQIEAYGPSFKPGVENLRRINADFIEPHEPVWAKIKRNYIYKPLLHLHVL